MRFASRRTDARTIYIGFKKILGNVVVFSILLSIFLYTTINLWNRYIIYPAILSAILTSMIAIVGLHIDGYSWFKTLLFVGMVHSIAYSILGQAVFTVVNGFTPTQIPLMMIAVAIATKISLFSPTFIYKIFPDTQKPDISKEDVILVFSSGWLIQGCMSVIYQFELEMLASIHMWILPNSPLNNTVSVMFIGIIISQIIIAKEIHG